MSKSSTTARAIATPNRVTAHPDEVLNEEFLKPLGMSVNALADGTDARRGNPQRDRQERAGSKRQIRLCVWRASVALARTSSNRHRGLYYF